MSDHLVNRGKAKARHDLPQLLGNEHHVIDHVLGLAREALAQAAILRGDAHRTGVLLAIALHETAHRDERHGRKAELLGSEQAGDGDITAVHELAVRLEDHPRAQAVLHERLLRLGQSHFEGQTCVMDGIARCGAGTAIGTRNQNLVRATLGNARRDSPDTGLGNELDRNARLRIGVLQVEDELGEVLDGVDVVMRRRRDEADARRGTARAGNPRPDLLTGKMAALTRLGALRHLDLQLACAHEVAARHAKAPRGNLLDRRALAVTVGKQWFACGILAALAGVGTTSEAVHGDGEAFVCLLRDGTVAHGARVEALDDLARRLDLLEGNCGPLRIEVEQVAQDDSTSLLMHGLAVLLEELRVILAYGTLQEPDDLRRDEMLFAPRTP